MQNGNGERITLKTRTLETLKLIIAEQFKQILEAQTAFKTDKQKKKDENAQTPINSIKNFINNLQISPNKAEKIEISKSNISIDHMQTPNKSQKALTENEIVEIVSKNTLELMNPNLVGNDQVYLSLS